MSELTKSGDWSYCPACGGGIDTGYECGECGRDWLEYHETGAALRQQLAEAQARVRELEQAVLAQVVDAAPIDATVIKTSVLTALRARMQRQREILTSLVTVVGQMKVPQTIADAALQLLIVGPVLKRAQDFIAKKA